MDVIPIRAGNLPDVVQVIQQQWAQIGVTLNIVASTNVVQDFFTDHKAQLGASPIASSRADRRVAGPALVNTCGYDDPELNAMAAQLARKQHQRRGGADLGRLPDERRRGRARRPARVRGERVRHEDEKLGDMPWCPTYCIVPDMWQLYVKA